MLNSTIALIGNPNCGKTTLFNTLTGSNQRTGNWPGVTVERKEGQFSYQGNNIKVVDLPGVYSLDVEDGDTGMDELIARDYLLRHSDNLILNIVDATNLERNLYLTTQVMEMGVPMLIALNMMDLAQSRGIQIDPEILSQRLNCPVIPISAAKGEGMAELMSQIVTFRSHIGQTQTYVPYPPAIDQALTEIVTHLEKDTQCQLVKPRWQALNLLQYEDRIAPESVNPELLKLVVKHRRHIHQMLGEDIDILIADSRYGFIHQVTQGATHHPGEMSASFSERLDHVVLNRWLGIPIFLSVMYLLFLLTINLSSVFIDFFDLVTGAIFVDGLGALLAGWNMPGWLIALLADGIGGGIQTVSTFIPVIGLMFLFLSILEDSGYMSRAAFVMDRFMRLVGLPGKSFVPMLVGFGCNVPAIMATRTLESPRDRLITMVMNPFMSCGARLPVYALFAAAFFPVGGQNIVFGLYVVGIIAAIFTGLVMRSTILKGQGSPFIMELPTYHLPRLKGVLMRTWERLQGFIWKAGKVIVLMVMILGLLNSVGVDGSFGNQDSERSVLSVTSKAITPIFAPMGITQENWPATVGIFTGVFAKEAMVGTLDSIYTQLGNQEKIDITAPELDFWGSIGEAFATIPANLAALPAQLLDPLGVSAAKPEHVSNSGAFGVMAARFNGQKGAFAYLLFVLLYFPCVSTTAAIYRESNLRWTIFVCLWTTGVAYFTASLFYQIGTFAQHPAFSTFWIAGVLMTLTAIFTLMRLARPVPSIR